MIKYGGKIESLAVKFSNFILERFTSDYYQKMVKGAIIYGMNAAADDSINNRPVPPNWWEDRRNLSG